MKFKLLLPCFELNEDKKQEYQSVSAFLGLEHEKKPR